MNISVIGTVGLPASYGGFETLVEYLTDNLSNHYKLTVYCSRPAYKSFLQNYKGAELVYLPFKANGIQSIPYDVFSMIHASRRADVLLILGVSGCIFLPVLRWFYKRKIIVNIDGLEWKRDKWSTLVKRFLKFSERLAVRYSDVVVADNPAITDYVFNEYGNEAVTIAYGADHVRSVGFPPRVLEKYPVLSSPYYFKVCRIEPENNIKMILSAFSKIPEKKLVIVGNWDSSEFGKRQKEAFSSFCNIFLLDPIYDQDILNQFRSNCICYVHGHSAGGTNPSLVEAMYLGLPILAFGVNYNRETTNHQALYFHNEQELIDLVNTTSDESLRTIGVAMKTYASEHYTWERISSQYSQLFNEKED